MQPHYCSINVGGRLLGLNRPVVMGIVNATPDSFYGGSRVDADTIEARVRQMCSAGAAIIDVGACSTRPGSTPCSAAEEAERLAWAVPAVFRAWPEAVVSVDTFRPEVARMAVEQLGAHIINDVGDQPADKLSQPGMADSATEQLLTPMMREAVSLRVPYILMSRARDVDSMLPWLAARVEAMHALGHRDIIIDPGFGFGRTPDEDLRLLARMWRLQVLGLPILVGMSRKRMAWQTLGITAEQSLNATTVLNTLALERGADILRVHDVAEAAQTIELLRCTEQMA